jgi:hypothetical protein
MKNLFESFASQAAQVLTTVQFDDKERQCPTLA